MSSVQLPTFGDSIGLLLVSEIWCLICATFSITHPKEVVHLKHCSGDF